MSDELRGPDDEALGRRLASELPRYTAPALAPIDSLLTRLEQEKLYAIP